MKNCMSFISRDRRSIYVLYIGIFLLLAPYVLYLSLYYKYVVPPPIELDVNPEQLEAESSLVTILNGVPMPLAQGLSQRIHPAVKLNNMRPFNSIGWKQFQSFLARRDVECDMADRVGAWGGAWPICLAGPYMPTRGRCTVLTIGSLPDSVFQRNIQKLYRCNTIGSQTDKDMIITSLKNESLVIDYAVIDTARTCGTQMKLLNTTGALSRIKQLALHLHVSYFQDVDLQGGALTHLQACLQGLRRAGFFRWYDFRTKDNWFKRLAGYSSPKNRQERHQVFVNVKFLVGALGVQQPPWILEKLGTDQEYVPPFPHLSPVPSKHPCGGDASKFPQGQCN